MQLDLPIADAASVGERPARHTTPSEAAASALRCLLGELGELGKHVPSEPFAARAQGCTSSEWLAEQLRRHGRPARVVRVESVDLGQLQLPTLIMLRSGAALTLSAVHARTVTLLCEHGRRERMTRAALATRLSGEALDVSWPLGQRGPFLKRLLQLVDREKRRFVAPLMASGMVLALSLLGPLLTRSLMDRALPAADLSLLHAIVLGTLLIALQSAWLSMLRERALLALTSAFESASSQGLYAQFVRFPFLQAQARSVGAFCEALSSAVAISQSATSLLLAPVLDGATALAYLILLYDSLPLVAALGVGLGLLMLGLAAGFAPQLARNQEALIDASAQQQSRLHELLSGACTLKTCGAERAATARWLPVLIGARALAIRQSRLQQWLELGSVTLRQLVALAVFSAGARACLAGELSVGGFVASVMLADGYLAAVSRLAGLAAPLFTTQGRLRPLDALLKVEPQAIEREPHARLEGIEDAIVLDDVWFRYAPDGPWILKGYQLRVRHGEQFVLRGPSGMGKTTILRLIAGLLTPEQGKVSVLGRTASAGAVAYLPQDAALFAGSIMSNLRILSGADHERIHAAARATGLADLAAQLPMGLETLLPPGGSNLSGGQRQLVLMTAAVASQRPTLLLDESLANLDSLTQQRLRQSALFAGKTVLTVAHDP
jgi:ABC-type bacteriocin/lantibiotic exporter with double-glycine peptidase domain